MLRSVQLAKRFGVELGAHISYPDLMGFGRRRMGLSESRGIRDQRLPNRRATWDFVARKACG